MKDKITILADQVMRKNFPVLLGETVDVGEIPYQANIELEEMDMTDIPAVREKAMEMLIGLDELIFKMEEYQDAAAKVRKRSIALLHSS